MAIREEKMLTPNKDAVLDHEKPVFFDDDDELVNENGEVLLKNEKHNNFDYENGEVILDVRHLKQFFRYGRGIYKYTKAVHDVSFKVYKGEVFGLVGESGCGKTTTGRSIIKLYKITSGSVYFKGVRIAAGTRWNEKEIKFTKIRLAKKLKQLKKEKRNAIKEFKNTHELEKDFKIRFKNKFQAIFHDELANKEYYQLLDLYNKKINNEILKASEIIEIQRRKIKESKFDDKNCNKEFAKSQVAIVNEKYKDIINKEKEVGFKNFDDADKLIYAKYKKDLKEAKKSKITTKMQMIFQDPIASLNPRMTVKEIIAEGLRINGIRDNDVIVKRVSEMLELVGLLPEHMTRYPHEFSGGQRQRIGIARALIMNPELVIADEPVSALDVSIQAQVINLLNDLREKFGLTILFIAHNLSVVKYFCDRIAVMYYGELVELATSEELFKHPLHPYTKSLLSAVPEPDPNVEKGRKRIIYDPSKAHDYSKQKPSLRELSKGHFVLCNDEEENRYINELEK